MIHINSGHKKETTFLDYVQVKWEVKLSRVLEIYPTELKKGTSGSPIWRPKGSLSTTTTKLIREHISQAIYGEK